MLHFHNGARRAPTYRAGPVHLNPSFEPPSGISLQPGAQLEVVFTFQLVGQCLYLAWQKALYSNNMLFPWLPPSLCVHSCSYRYGKEQILWIFFLQWGNKSVALFLPSKPLDKGEYNLFVLVLRCQILLQVILISLGYERKRAANKGTKQKQILTLTHFYCASMSIFTRYI